ncbi:MAG: hypothetical protein PVI59_01115 [Anaerolineae bacterium]|jgi:hypothetical protein
MSGKEAARALIAVLDRHRPALRALPGVVGTGVGLAEEAQSTEDVTVQVFVKDSADVTRVRRQAQAILGQVPLEVIVTGEVVAGE